MDKENNDNILKLDDENNDEINCNNEADKKKKKNNPVRLSNNFKIQNNNIDDL